MKAATTTKIFYKRLQRMLAVSCSGSVAHPPLPIGTRKVDLMIRLGAGSNKDGIYLVWGVRSGGFRDVREALLDFDTSPPWNEVSYEEPPR